AVAGELLDAGATCSGGGATSYATSFICAGSGVVRCGSITGLRPGAWVNHLTVTVSGSDPQTQNRPGGLAAGVPSAGTWTVYPRTFVVTDATESNLRARLDAAATYTAANARPALVTFSRVVFPGAQAPRTIDLAVGPCSPEPSRPAAI